MGVLKRKKRKRKTKLKLNYVDQLSLGFHSEFACIYHYRIIIGYEYIFFVDLLFTDKEPYHNHYQLQSPNLASPSLSLLLPPTLSSILDQDQSLEHLQRPASGHTEKCSGSEQTGRIQPDLDACCQ